MSNGCVFLISAKTLLLRGDRLRRDTFSLACFSVKEDSCLKMQLNKEVKRPIEETIIATILILHYIKG
ncbi:hypothetical protein DN389_10015 [Bacillus sp. AY3-1]|nr:hypothetical protein DN389_10015 [Bacillus sp. AY3-1]PEP17330.1 hypothetical protein CN552_05835 [Bacillus wiedmannii]PHB08202.1 hypothetical protein COE81_06550 [Bacillus wiedmannii]